MSEVEDVKNALTRIRSSVNETLGLDAATKLTPNQVAELVDRICKVVAKENVGLSLLARDVLGA